MRKDIEVRKYIEVSHLKKSVEGLQDCYNGFSDTYDKACIIGLIDEEPVADVVPVVHAKLLNPNPYGLCSHCNYLIDIRDEFNYCPKCGAMLKTDEVTE